MSTNNVGYLLSEENINKYLLSSKMCKSPCLGNNGLLKRLTPLRTGAPPPNVVPQRKSHGVDTHRILSDGEP